MPPIPPLKQMTKYVSVQINLVKAERHIMNNSPHHRRHVHASIELKKEKDDEKEQDKIQL